MSARPPRLTTSRELLVDDLQRLLTVETTLAKATLPKLIQEVDDEELKTALEQHLGETRSHTDNIKRALAELGEEEAAKEAPGLDGLKQEHDSGIGEVAPSLRDAFDAGAAMGRSTTKSRSTRARSYSPSRLTRARRRNCSRRTWTRSSRH